MAALLTAFVVESPAVQDGRRLGTFRLYVATEARAREVAAGHPERTWRELPIDAVPEGPRKALLDVVDP